MQLIVLGMHRSGTSVLARLLNLMGAYFGPEGSSTGANAENPKGFWERRDVRNLNDSVLHAMGCDWNRVAGFEPEKVPARVAADFERTASRLILELDAHRPWMLKEPRLCLLFPLWRRLLESPVCIHVFRHPVEVAASLLHRNEMPMEAGLALWEKYVRLAVRASAEIPGIVVSHHALMLDPVQEVARLNDCLVASGVRGLRLPEPAEIEGFVRPELYRERIGRDDLAPYVAAPQVRLFEDMIASRSPVLEGPDRMSPKAARALRDYEAGLPPFVPPAQPAASPPGAPAVDRKVLDALRADLAAALEALARLEASRTSQDAIDEQVAERERALAELRTMAAAFQAEAAAAAAELEAAREAAREAAAEAARQAESLGALRERSRQELQSRDAHIARLAARTETAEAELEELARARARLEAAVNARLRDLGEVSGLLLETARTQAQATGGTRDG